MSKAKFIYTRNRTYRCTRCGWEYKELPPEDPDSNGNGCPNCWLVDNTKGRRQDVNIQ